MSKSLQPTRRQILATSAILSAASVLPERSAGAAEEPSAVRPFHIAIAEADIVDLRRRLQATRWARKETVADSSQGVQLAPLEKLAGYWSSGYDWRKAEEKLNALPQFTTEIDGLDIHFIQVKSRHANALPLIITHGWPGSVVEMLEVIGPLTDPTAHGGRPEDAFDLVLPSLPGYGFSAVPISVGWSPLRTAQAWAELMGRLGYTRYVAQGGDIGANVTDVMARLAPKGLLGVHFNFLGAIPPEFLGALFGGAPPPKLPRKNRRHLLRSPRLTGGATLWSRSHVRRRLARP